MSHSVAGLLEEHLERIRRGEIDRLFRRLQLGEEQKNAVEALSRNIVDRVMEMPVSLLKAASDAGTEGLARSASRLFNLGHEGH